VFSVLGDSFYKTKGEGTLKSLLALQETLKQHNNWFHEPTLYFRLCFIAYRAIFMDYSVPQSFRKLQFDVGVDPVSAYSLSVLR